MNVTFFCLRVFQLRPKNNSAWYFELYGIEWYTYRFHFNSLYCRDWDFLSNETFIHLPGKLNLFSPHLSILRIVMRMSQSNIERRRFLKSSGTHTHQSSVLLCRFLSSKQKNCKKFSPTTWKDKGILWFLLINCTLPFYLDVAIYIQNTYTHMSNRNRFIENNILFITPFTNYFHTNLSDVTIFFCGCFETKKNIWSPACNQIVYFSQNNKNRNII